MRRLVRAFSVTLGIAALVFVAPILWSAFGTNGYFESNRYWNGACCYLCFQNGALYELYPDNWSLVSPLRRAADGWDVLARVSRPAFAFAPAVTNGQVIAHLRLQGGDLYETSPGSTFSHHHARIYNIWSVWQARLFPRQYRVAQKINCVNNLKQLGLGFRIWAGDHDNQSPFNLSTNAGGAKELTAADIDGFHQNAWLALQTMSNELAVTVLLICPKDRVKKPATNWDSLTDANLTYRFPTGTNGIRAICPLDGNILYEDGTVIEKQPSGK